MRKLALFLADVDDLFVCNLDDGLGESSRSEIEYAKKNGRSVNYLELTSK